MRVMVGSSSSEFVKLKFPSSYSDILCFVHILIEHYRKYNNKNKSNIKLSSKAKPIFVLRPSKGYIEYLFRDSHISTKCSIYLSYCSK